MQYRNLSESFLEQLVIRRANSAAHTDLSMADILKDHRADDLTQASLSAIQTTSFVINRLRTQTLRRINEAIGRWCSGKYGTCLQCRHPIKAPRLSVLPEAERCLRCQNLKEKHEI